MSGCDTRLQLGSLLEFRQGICKILFGKQDGTVTEVGARGISVQLQRAAVVLQCCGVVFLIFVKIAEMNVRFRIGRIQRSRYSVLFFRTFEIRRMVESGAETKVTNFGVRVQGLQFMEFDNTLGDEITLEKSGAKIAASVEILGIQALGFAILVNSRIDVALIMVGVAEIVVYVRVVGVESERLLVLRDGTIQIAFVVEQQPQVITR